MKENIEVGEKENHLRAREDTGAHSQVRLRPGQCPTVPTGSVELPKSMCPEAH